MNYRKQIRSEILRRNPDVISGYFMGFVFEKLLCICFPGGLIDFSLILSRFFLNYPDSSVKKRLV